MCALLSSNDRHSCPVPCVTASRVVAICYTSLLGSLLGSLLHIPIAWKLIHQILKLRKNKNHLMNKNHLILMMKTWMIEH